MDIRRSGYVLLALGFALSIYGHMAFSMGLATVGSVLGTLALVAAFWWPTIGLAVTAAACAIIAGTYGTTDGLSIVTALSMAVFAVAFTVLALPRLGGNGRFVLAAGALAFAANLWYIWNNVISAWTPQFAFVNIAMALGFGLVAWTGWTAMRADASAAPARPTAGSG